MTDVLPSQNAPATSATSASSLPSVVDGWTEVGPVERIPRDRGVAALVAGPEGPEPVAIFRLSPPTNTDGSIDADASDEWYAVSHIEPQSGSAVMARGLVGSLLVEPDDGGEVELVPTVASPLLKQRYDLRNGRCLDDSTLALTAYQIELADGQVRVRPH